MKFVVEKEIFEKLPTACFGVVVAKGIDNGKSYPTVDALLDESIAAAAARQSIIIMGMYLRSFIRCTHTMFFTFYQTPGNNATCGARCGRFRAFGRFYSAFYRFFRCQRRKKGPGGKPPGPLLLSY